MCEGRFFSPIIEDSLPLKVYSRICELVESGKMRAADISEIRLRVGGDSSVSAFGENIPLYERISPSEIADCVTRLCRGSVYAHMDTIRAGYIRVGEGIRVGACGILAADGRAVSEITSLNIRIAHIIRGVSERFIKLCYEPPKIKSLLIYSPPGVGKTTVLRETAAQLGGKFSRRVALIDTRGELYIEKMFTGAMCDVLSGYPRALGIEIATRTLSPEVIICDELGDADEAKGLLSAQNTGVPIIASAHASSVGELLSRPNIRMLHDVGIFSGYVGLSREGVNGKMGRCFSFDYTPREAAGMSVC